MNKKYFLVKTNEEVNFGDVIACKSIQETSFGTISSYIETTLTPSNVKDFIKEGIIKCEDHTGEQFNDITPYIERLARKMNTSPKEVIEMLDTLNKVCPKAVLDLLLQTIAVAFYENNPTAFNKAEEYFSLKAKDGTVGKVYSLNSYIPLFKSANDAEKARELLKKQLDLMYGKSKNC